MFWKKEPIKNKIVWLDLGGLGDLIFPRGDLLTMYQDHGMGLLRTILHQNGITTDLLSTRLVISWSVLEKQLKGHEMLLMNVRSYNYSVALKSASIFKKVNPNGIVLVGGIHATICLADIVKEDVFDRICQGPGEGIIVDLVKNPSTFARVTKGVGAKSLAEWPMIDRTLWPKPHWLIGKKFKWPLEPECGWESPSPVATIITSRVCPWQCAFCNENSYIPNMGRRPVDMVIDELNELDGKYGVESVVIHDSMFFQSPSWLKEWVEKYPRRSNKVWPYWAAARADTIHQWPDLFKSLIFETNWRHVSVGFEAGSDRILRLLNKECTAHDNAFTIDLLNRLGDELESKGKIPPKFWANVILGIPGESPEEAFETFRMVKAMRRADVSYSYFAPYPGSVLGYQLIAEGKSLMSKDNYNRYPTNKNVKGIDYKFYKDMRKGKYNKAINEGLDYIAKYK